MSRTAEVAAPAAALFALVADPHRHRELDGSGTVGRTVSGPSRLAQGDRFSVNMKQYGVPYRITSRVTALEPDRLIEWRHPMGHRWRWRFEPLGPDRTRVTETFDYRLGGLRDRLDLLGRLDAARRNAAGIEATLAGLQQRFPG